MNRSRLVVASLGFALVSALPARGQGKVEIDRFDADRGEHGLSLVVAGSLSGVPDRTRVRVVIALEGGEGPVQVAEVGGGRFTARLGPYKQRVLPGTYVATATIHGSLQLVDVAPIVSDLKLEPGRRELLIGTPEEAAEQRAKLLRSYQRLLGDLRLLRGNLDMWGTASTMRTITARMVHRSGELPERAGKAIIAEWEKFSADDFIPILASLRADHRQLGEYVLLSYFPMIDPLLTEIGSNLERMHAGFTVAIHRNLGRQPPKEATLRGNFVLEDLRTNVDGLAANAYQILGVAKQTWTIDGSLPERVEDAKGDVFHSTITKFEVRKPTPWTFDVNGTTPTMRLRMVPPKDLVGRVATGVELHDFPMAESFGELAELDEALARNSHRGVELKKVKRLAVSDPTMPQGVRPGQELRFTSLVGDANTRFTIIQYSLFCRWHKRTYSLMCIAREGQEAAFEPTFSAICQSFKVLDAPQQQAESTHPQDGR